MMTNPIDKQAYEDAVARLLEQINMGRGFDDLFDSIYDRLQGTVPYNRMAVALFDESGERLKLISCRSDGRVHLKVGYAAAVQGSTLFDLLRTTQPRIINDLPDYLREKPSSASTRLIVREGMQSNLTLPLVADGKPIGALFFSSREKNTYTGAHAALLRRLAGHIAVSVEKSQLIDKLERQNEELRDANQLKQQFVQKLKEEVDRQTNQLAVSERRYRLLVTLGQIINASLDLKRVFSLAAEEIHRLAGCRRVSLLLVSLDGHSRHGFAIEFLDGEPRWIELPTVVLSGTAAEWVMKNRQARVVRSLATVRHAPEDQRLYEQGYLAYVYLPLICRDECVGVLGLASTKEGEPDGWDLELLGELGSMLAVALDNASAYTQIAELKRQLEQENVYLRDEIKTEHDFANIVGGSREMADVRRAIRQVAQTDSTVLVVGETGTGKELIARALHDSSPRRDKLLVKVNCAALAPGVIASELFGHEEGAFTGAGKRRQGRFELAHHGTLFIDEVAEIPAETQVMLLRVLQEKVIERVGGSEPIDIDVRVIAATNRDLKAAVADGRFRSDLYYRLNVFPIPIPPLRERRGDVPVLMNHFIGRLSRRMDKRITRVARRAMELMMRYDWPGNVRELENIIERAMIVTSGDTLEIDPTWLCGSDAEPAATQEQLSMAEVQRRAILDALERSAGRVYGSGGAAEGLGLKPTTLYGKMQRLGIHTRRPARELR